MVFIMKIESIAHESPCAMLFIKYTRIFSETQADQMLKFGLEHVFI